MFSAFFVLNSNRTGIGFKLRSEATKSRYQSVSSPATKEKTSRKAWGFFFLNHSNYFAKALQSTQLNLFIV
jgi:hypothetical protein